MVKSLSLRRLATANDDEMMLRMKRNPQRNRFLVFTTFEVMILKMKLNLES